MAIYGSAGAGALLAARYVSDYLLNEWTLVALGGVVYIVLAVRYLDRIEKGWAALMTWWGGRR